jgi:HEPN domain-containing protein
MIPAATMKSIARARLRDAGALLRAGRFDATAYVCGYVVEIALKARVCRTLKWSGFPETPAEFKGLSSLKTHDLRVLMRFSGVQERIREKHQTEWSLAVDWDPETRYQEIGRTSAEQARALISAVRTLLRSI